MTPGSDTALCETAASDREGARRAVARHGGWLARACGAGYSWAMVTALFICATAVLTWPQLLRPASVPPHQDSWFSMWRLAWIAHQLPRDPGRLFDANIYYPEPRTLAYSDATLLQGLLGAPLLWSGVPTPVVYDLLVFVSFVFAGVGAWMLVSRLTGSTAAGIAAGLLFAFAPYRFDHYMHLELLWAGWMPIALLALHQALTRGHRGWGVAVGLLFAAQVLSCIYYGVFFATVLPVIGLILASGSRRRILGRAGASLLAGGLVATPVLLLYMQPYRGAAVDVGERKAGEVQLYSAGPTHYLSATPDNLLYGWTAGLGRAEKRLFPGACAFLLMVVALWPPVDRMRVACLAGLLVAVDLSFGLNGLTFGWLRDHVVAYRGLRVPARAGQIALLMVATLAGYGLARLEGWWRSREFTHARSVITLLLAGMTVELVAGPLTLVPAATSPAPIYRWLRAQPPGVVAELPMPHEHYQPLYDAEFSYASTFHWKRIVNGHSGNVPWSYVRLLRSQETFPSDTSVGSLRHAGVTYVLVHERLLGSAEYGRIVRALAVRPDIEPQGPFNDGDGEAMAYRLLHD